MQTNEALTRFDFNGTPILAIEHEGDLWMTGEDIGRALEYANPRHAIKDLYTRNKAELDQYSTVLKVPTAYRDAGSGGSPEDPEEGGSGRNLTPDVGDAGAEIMRLQAVRLYSEEGVIVLTMLSSQPKAAAFRKWAVKVLKAYRHGELALSAANRSEGVLLTCIKEARFGNPVALHTLIERYGYPESIRIDVKADLLRRAKGLSTGAPELVEWFIDVFLPRLQAEVEADAGPLIEAIRSRPPYYSNWREVHDDPAAIWALHHRPTDLFTFIGPFADDDGVDMEVTSHRFTRWLVFCGPRLRACGWDRVRFGHSKGHDSWRLRLLK